MSINAVIPVRAGSRRLPNKNIARFGNSTLLEWKIDQLLKVKEINRITVSSDSDLMLEMASKKGAETHKRAPEYCDEKTKTFGEVVKHICESVQGEHILWATCTAPLVLPQNYSEAIERYFEALKSGFDSLMSVEPFKRYIWTENGPLNYKLGLEHVPSQELDQLYFVTDGILMAPREKMIEWSYFHGTKPFKYELNKINCVDIDDEYDLSVSKAWFKDFLE
ncbi:MAG: acylneuraminate cytidylyltransferase family protein [Cytophagia bacterium]|nr:acylneuraminate cytidylyltransferase family protein [Cytophagia bacterium]